MESVLKIAAYIIHRYSTEFHEKISEMKLHKLLYFTQREALIQFNELLFEDQFQAWKFGPVMCKIRIKFSNNELTTLPEPDFIKKYKSVFDYVFENYASKDAWSLSRLSHGEYAWQIARKGLPSSANCAVEIRNSDIKLDAEKIKLRRLLINSISKSC